MVGHQHSMFLSALLKLNYFLRVCVLSSISDSKQAFCLEASLNVNERRVRHTHTLLYRRGQTTTATAAHTRLLFGETRGLSIKHQELSHTGPLKRSCHAGRDITLMQNYKLSNIFSLCLLCLIFFEQFYNFYYYPFFIYFYLLFLLHFWATLLTVKTDLTHVAIATLRKCYNLIAFSIQKFEILKILFV